MKKTNSSARKICLFICVVAFLGMTVLEWTANQSAAAPQAGQKIKKELVYANAIDVTSIDKMENSTVVGNTIWDMIFDCLITMEPETYKLVPRLAESWDEISPTEYVFHLRKGVKFHNGEEMKASDVKFTFERQMKMPAVAANVSNIKEIVLDDDYTVRLILHEPNQTFLERLSLTGSGVESEKAIKDNGGVYVPVGTGPYKFVEWVPSDHITIDKFQDCWDKGAVSERITMRVMPEGATRVIALETGDIDIALEPPVIDLKHIQNSNTCKLLQIPACKLDYFSFNTQKEPFKNLAVRQAMAYAVNKQEIIDAVLEGFGIPANNVVGAGTMTYTDDLKGFKQDLEKAKTMMKEAGHAAGFKMTVTLNGDVRERIAQVLQAQFAELNVELTINNLDNATHRQIINSGEFESSVSAWSNVGDPDIILRNMFHSSMVGVNNRTHMSDPEFDARIDAAVVETDQAKRLQMYKELQQDLLITCAMIPIYYETLNVGVGNGVENVFLNAGGTHWFKYAYVVE